MNFINLSSIFLSILFSITCLMSNNYIMLWLTLELSILSMIPCFFFGYTFLNNYKSLLYFLVISCLSSGLLYSGLLLLNFGGIVFLYISNLLKFMFFPFGLWIYIVFLNVNWLVIWVVSVCFKIITPLINTIFNGNIIIFYYFCIFAVLTFFFNSIYFWFGVSNLSLIWCNLSVSSGILLFLNFYFNSSFCYYLLYYYLIWSTLSIFIFSFFNLNNSNQITNSNILFFIYSIPFSLSLIYKILLVLNLLFINIDWWIIFFIFFYIIVEQYYLFKFFGFNYSSFIYNNLN